MACYGGEGLESKELESAPCVQTALQHVEAKVCTVSLGGSLHPPKLRFGSESNGSYIGVRFAHATMC